MQPGDSIFIYSARRREPRAYLIRSALLLDGGTRVRFITANGTIDHPAEWPVDVRRK